MKTILLADSEMSERACQKKMLTQCGYSIIGEAENNEQAVEQFVKLKPDLVVVRLVPTELAERYGIDGIEVTKEIRKIDNNALIIVATEYASHSICIEAIACGVNNIVLLPHPPRMLTTAVEKLIGKP